MDIVTYALLKKQIDGIAPGYTYKGSVGAVGDLPESGTPGDLYTIDGEQYVWDGSEWVNLVLGDTISNAQINALFT